MKTLVKEKQPSRKQGKHSLLFDKRTSLRSKKILIIEDEVPLLKLLRETFADAGFLVFSAKSGREGLEKAFEERPDLILLDILMPQVDGLTVLKRLRQDRYKWGKYVPVILLSNLSNAETIREGMKHADDYLVKAEWTLEDLAKKVKEKLKTPAVR